jgi:hypothetical protein
MHALLTLLLVFLTVGVVSVLVLGVIGLFRGADPRRSNKLMQYRVILQGAALVVVFLLVLLFRS